MEPEARDEPRLSRRRLLAGATVAGGLYLGPDQWLADVSPPRARAERHRPLHQQLQERLGHRWGIVSAPAQTAPRDGRHGAPPIMIAPPSDRHRGYPISGRVGSSRLGHAARSS